MKKFAQLVKTNENMDLTQEVDAIPEEDVAPTELEESAEVTEMTGEVDASLAEGEEIVEGIADAEQAVTDLEALSEIVTEAQVDGGLTPTEAIAVEATHESIMSSIGLSHRNSDYVLAPVYEPSNYALNNAMRGPATVMTHENLQANIKTVGNLISIGVQKLGQIIKDLIAKFMEMAKRYEMMISLLERQVNAIPRDAQMANKSTDDRQLCEAVTVKGTANATGLMNALNVAQQLIVVGASDIQAYTANMASRVPNAIGEVTKRMSNYAKIGEGLSGARKTYFREDQITIGIEATPIAQSVDYATREQMLALLQSARKLDSAMITVRDRLSKAQAALSQQVKTDLSGGHVNTDERIYTKAIYATASSMSQEANNQMRAVLTLIRASMAQYSASPNTAHAGGPGVAAP